MALGYLERKTSVKGKERLEGTLIQVAAAAAQAVTWVRRIILDTIHRLLVYQERRYTLLLQCLLSYVTIV